MTINSIEQIKITENSRFARLLTFLCVIDLLAVYYYGLRVVIVTLIAVVTSLLTDYLCSAVMKRKFDWQDPSPMMSGILLAMFMPATVPYIIMAVSCIFMITVGKYAFGGNKNLIFSPVAVAYAFCSIAWSRYIMWYPVPKPIGDLPLGESVTDGLVHSFTYMLDAGSAGTFSALDIVWGKLAGPMGTTCVLLILICGVAMYFFGDIEPTVFFTGIGAHIHINVLFPGNADGWQSFVYALVTGSYMFTLVFMGCDRRFVPKHEPAQFLYAMVIAVGAFLFRRYTAIENGGLFALLIASLFRDEFDRWSVALHNFSLSINDKIIANHAKNKARRDARRVAIDSAKSELSDNAEKEVQKDAN